MAYNAGSVSAKIQLDTSEFDKSIKKLIEDVSNLKGNLKNSGADQLSKDVEALKSNFNNLSESVEKLINVNNDYKKQLSRLREENTNLNKDLSEQSKLTDNLTESLKKSESQARRTANQYRKMGTDLNKSFTKDLYKAVKNSPDGYLINFYDDLKKKYKPLVKNKKEFDALWQDAIPRLGTKLLPTRDPSKFVNFYTGWGNETRNFGMIDKSALKSVEEVKESFRELKTEEESVVQETAKVKESFSKINPEVINKAVNAVKALNNETQKVASSTRSFKQYSNNWEITVQQLKQAGQGLTTLERRLKSTEVNVTQMAETFTIMNNALATNNFRIQSAVNIMGTYSKGVERTKQKMKELEIQTKQTFESMQVELAKANAAQYKYWKQTRGTSGVSGWNTKPLQFSRNDYYSADIAKINAEVEKYNNNLAKSKEKQDSFNESTRKGQMSMREFGTAMGKGEAYSNNLYRGLQKVRSVIISIKTITAMMGAMAIWNFGSELVESVKETYAAKSEMESLLERSSKVDAEGIKEVNSALDDVTQKFQRINKYSLGETAASIGLEFDLNAKEIAKSAEIIAMVQNEYARAGRSNEEAALAVKDILQGEFRRLSMETGIGEKELTGKYGWSGEKEDVMGLMKALEKAGKDRHWDIFASKATSLNDVITITKSRFGEFGADLVTNVEPMILSSFNAITGAIDFLKGKFDSMGTFGQYLTMGGVATGLGAIVSALIMFKKGMSIAEISTIGFGRSLGTAILGLKKADVATHGFLKTLFATITGTDAATVANKGLAKSIAARVLGVNQDVVAQKGLLTALVSNKMALKGVEAGTLRASVASAKWYQKLAYLIGNVKASDVATLKWHQSLRKIIFSTKMLRFAVLGVTTIAFAAWFAGIAMAADRAKKAMDNFNNINKNGAKIAKDAQKSVDKYQEKLDGLSKSDKNYKKISTQLDIAKDNKTDIDNAIKRLKTYKKEYNKTQKSIEANQKVWARQSQKLARDNDKYLPTTNYDAQMKEAMRVRTQAQDNYNTRLYKSYQHINAQVKAMKEANVAEEKRLAYVAEYEVQAKESADLWKKFDEGDIKSGFYAVLSDLKLLWIDLWNNASFLHFWNSLKKTWEDLKPTAYAIKDALIGIGEALLNFFSTDVGKFTLMAAGIGLVSLKIGKWVTGASSVFSVLKTVGTKVWDLAKGWKSVGKEAEEASKKLPKDTTSTGGINGDISKTTGGIKKGKFWETVGQDAKNTGRMMFKYMGYVAAAMVVVSTAIIMIQAPMGALAATGEVFKRIEPQIRKGIEGLQLVAPTIIALLIPVMSLMAVVEKLKIDSSQMFSAFGKAALGIGIGLGLVAETILMLVPSILALGAVGATYGAYETQVKQGAEAMKLLSDSLMYLLPFVPALAGGILLGIAIFESGGLGFLLAGSAAVGIAISLGLVAETIYLLQAPLWSIGEIGRNFKDLSDAKQGAEAIKLTAEAMGYVEEATRLMALVKWELIAGYIADIIGNWVDVDLTKLTEEGGFFDELNQFTTDFNKLNITPADSTKVEALNTVSKGLSGVSDALENAKTAIDNIPPEFRKNGLEGTTGDQLGLVNNTSTGQNKVDTEGYFDQLKEPLKALSTFVKEFNNGDYGDFSKNIDPAKIDAITSAANMLEQVKQAVQKVNDVMWNSGMGNQIANLGTGVNIDFGSAVQGLLNPIGTITGMNANNSGSSSGSSSGSGDYVSSLGGQFKNIENIVEDLSTFSNNVTTLTSGDGKTGNVEGLTTFVDGVKGAIDKLVTTLNDNVPKANTNAKSIGTGIVTGLKEGIAPLNSVGATIPSKIANSIMTHKDVTYNTSNSLGKTTATKFKEGVNPMSEYMTWELSYVKSAMTDRQDELGDTAYNLGSHIANRFREGDDMHSPGIMARSMQDEVNYISEYLTNNNLGQMAYNLSNLLSSNFNLDFNLSNIKFPDMTQWSSQLMTVLPTVDSVKTQVSTKFGEMKNNVQGSFNSILSKTQISMAGMKNATIGHIGNIKSSWRGMQDSLIASADHIKTQTSSKINTLKQNLGDFWNKIKNPELLIQGSAGGMRQGSIRRRSRPHLPQTGYAGGFDFKPKRSKGSPDDVLSEYLKCILETGEPCYAGWGFNWTRNISNRFKGWKTHFNKFSLDNFLNVGKFENSNFPVRGNAEVAKAYIYDVIRATRYGSYFDSNFGDDPVAALRAGVFNCWDGANIILAIARAFGFSGSMGHGTWNGIGHVWASIPGLGNIDATAIQNGYGFTSPKVKGYAGSIKRGKSSASVPDEANTTNNHNEVHIHINGDVYGVDDLNSKIEEGANRVARRLFRNSYSGV